MPTRRRISRLAVGIIGSSNRGKADRFRRVEQHLAQSFGVRRFLGQRPGCGCGNDFVGTVNQPERRRGPFVQHEGVHRSPVVDHHLLANPGELIVAGGRRTNHALLVTGRHRGDPADQVAEVVGQIGVVAFLESREREVAVAAKRDFLDQI